METMTAPTTEQRLDEISKRVDRGFNRIEGDIRELRTEIKAVDEGLRSEIKAVDESLRGEIKVVDDGLRGEIKGLRNEMGSGEASLRSEIKFGDDALRAEMSQGFAAMGARFDSLHRMVIVLLASALTTIAAAIIGVAIAAILTHF
jgi:phage-related protein